VIDKLETGKVYAFNDGRRLVKFIGVKCVFCVDDDGDEFSVNIGIAKRQWSELLEEKPVKKLYAYRYNQDGEVRFWTKEKSRTVVWYRVEEYDIVYPQGEE